MPFPGMNLAEHVFAPGTSFAEMDPPQPLQHHHGEGDGNGSNNDRCNDNDLKNEDEPMTSPMNVDDETPPGPSADDAARTNETAVMMDTGHDEALPETKLQTDSSLERMEQGTSLAAELRELEPAAMTGVRNL